mmetsp:Transcript_111156/g.319397  ORF Transcript_111156/g.319397 Transcript_111156/m.319397 type:complete len:89 (-) Transcript_111156:272-538(-)
MVSCKNGVESLACVGGAAGGCHKVADEARDGMMVTCAARAGWGGEARRRLPADVRRWLVGGTCACPNGKSYRVGDRWDNCRRGAQSLA